MQISGEEMFNNQDKTKKTSKIILISMLVLTVLIIGVFFVLLVIPDDSMKVYVNGVKKDLAEDVILIDENGKAYISIKDIAGYLGYTAHNGEYKLFSEDTNKCYVESADETASFFLNSNKILKMPPNQKENYEKYLIDAPVINKNGKLYTTEEGVKVGFNVTFEITGNSVQIYTLPYLVTYYTPIMEKYGYEELNEDFNNQKAILYNMFVVKSTNGLYGVVTSGNNEIISSKYKSMEFNESAQEFFVTSSTDKVGIVNSKAETKINLMYDDIKMLDKTNGLYVVKSNNKYGVLDSSGNTIIHLEFNEIGIDTTKFTSNGIENKYLLLDNLIPVQKNGKYGFFDITGKEVMQPIYDTIGYSEGNVNGKIVDNIVVIPSYKAIVVGKKKTDNKTEKIQYGIYDYKGNEIVPCVLDNAYSITNNGVSTYYMEHNGQTINIEEYIEQYNKYKNNQNNNANQ